MATTSADTQTGTVASADAQGSAGFPPFDGSTYESQILWLVLTFGLLYWMMSKVALPRISGILEDRRDRIAGDIAEANRLNEESNAAIAAYEQALAEARANAHKIAQDTRGKLKADIERRRTAAETELAKKLAEAETRIGEIKTAAMQNVDEIATDTTTALVERLIGKAPTKTELGKAVTGAMK